MQKVLYAGSFDPVTNGHIDIIKRASALFDHVCVAIADNMAKKPLFSVGERQGFLKKVIEDERLSNVEVDAFNCMTVEYAKKKGINIIIRGLRAISDFDFEFQMVLTNRQLEPDIEIVFLMPSQDHFYLSSHIIKEIVSLKGPVSKFVPAFVETALKQRLM
ncbi:MAG: pantetheine-phosphate adenylyltransferase [Candidatus Omnitrophica bacterium]|nr:pantetheine-phosphate adenylyltransferase [Candidatus Omnitrophota bacterium]